MEPVSDCTPLACTGKVGWCRDKTVWRVSDCTPWPELGGLAGVGLTPYGEKLLFY